ncbi:HipA family kinase [Spirosoma soli]|uniref:HipA family kinase n=1 Tax=Spirosoma soli TaxID=1770529 RepID=A0ABW5MB38_9BACT
MKITDPTYSLPVVHALQYKDAFESGTTNPMLVLGVDERSGQRGDYVVKWSRGQRMTTDSCCRELLGAWIGQQLNLHVAEPTVVSISPEFVETLIGGRGYRNAASSIGLNFGSTYVPGYIEFVRNQRLTDGQLTQAQAIFALDLFLNNPDRRVNNPNLLTKGDDILLFDHELAFAFTMDLPFLRNKTPWVFRDQDREWVENHYFYAYLRHKQIDFSAFIERLALVDAQFWRRAKQLLPVEWLSEQVNDIQDYLAAIVTHRTEFSNQLTQVLLQ